MQKLLTKTAVAGVALTLGSSFLLAGTVFADTLQNDLDASIDASLEVMNLVEGGATGVVHYAINPTNGDGVDGCNLSASSSLTVDVESSNTAVATVSPASLTFTNCTDVQTVTVMPVSSGQAVVTLEQTANLSGGHFRLSSASFLAIVADVPPVDTTPPVITSQLTPSPNAAGWNNANVTLEWTVTDLESDILFKAGCNMRTLTRETMGKMVTCVAQSEGGTSRESVTVKIDKSDPKIKIGTPMDGAHYELNESVMAQWSAHDRVSGIAQATGTVASGQPIDTSTLGEHTFSVQATDNAGNSSTKEVTYTVVAPDDDGDDEDNDDDEDEDNDDDEDDDRDNGRTRIRICHKGWLNLEVSIASVSAHLMHGDTLGRCRR